MPKPTKAELTKFKNLLRYQRNVLKGDVGSMRDEALRASEQDASVDHLADQGTDNYDQGFMLGLIENEEETIQLIEEALDRIDGKGEWAFGLCPLCEEEGNPEPPKTAKVVKGKAVKKAAPPPKKAPAAAKKIDPWIPKARLEYVPWARYCVRHQSEEERNREIA
jgi:RNA polymerase-binding transcription factor DksA